VARVWRRRRSPDTPRPAGRRWWRLRQRGSRATQLIARVGLRRQQPRTAEAAVLVASGSLNVTATRVTGAPVLPPAPRNEPVVHRPLARPEPAMRVRADGPVPLLPGERTLARRIRFAVVNGCTVGSLVMGMVAIFLAISGDPANLRLAAVAVLAGVVLDGCDGGLARRLGVASPFGLQLDSLADLSSFGVATGIVTYQWLVTLEAPQALAALVGVLIAVCAALRLARFNVSPKNGDHFWGVPTTMVAAVLALNILLGPESVPVMAHVAFAGVYALAMVTPFPYVKLARVLRLPLWLWVVPAICAMVSVPGTFVAVVGAYLVSGPVLWLLHRRDHDARPALA
jgi:CDP-diacylglycerol--serine O-phosphatidyltransferase